MSAAPPIVAAAITAALVLGLPAGPPREAIAQAPPVRIGAYLVKERQTQNGDRWEDAGIPRGFPMRLYLLPGNVYIWGENQQGYHSDYRVGFRDTPQGRVATIHLCHRWAGDIRQEGPVTKLVMVFTNNTVVQQTVLEYLGPLEQYRPPDARPEKMKCEPKHWPAGAVQGPPLAWAPARPFLLAGDLLAQAGNYRIVNGEMLIALALGSELSEDQRRRNIDQWLCIMRRGYPGLEVVEAGSPSQEVFVWPDGRFRARLRGGVVYRWALAATDCGTPRQEGATLGPGPLDPGDTEEKTVMACAASGGRFVDCRAWWLTRP